MGNNPFIFVVNGEAFASTVPEAIAISPAVSAALQANPLQLSFSISSELIESEDFDAFLAFVRCRDSISLSLPYLRTISFILISDSLGNEILSLGLFSSLKSVSGCDCEMAGKSCDLFASVSGGNQGSIFQVAIAECASQFYSYSVADLRSIASAALHRLLSSESLLIESEDSLLRLLVDLAVDRRDFFCHIKV
jgi:hypothetical protein